jgi:exopolyphosphatase/guanosine-5'-triphosphate,3'-diphosphate pyrophosphatase
LKKVSEIKTVGVIDIGSSAIRMVVMEIHPDGSFRRIDRASKPIQLGRDVFVNRVLGRETIVQAVRIMAGFRELLAGWGISPADTFTIAASSIREARNRDAFIDRVRVKTGLSIRIVDGVEENHLTWMAVLHAVGELRASFARTASIIMEVGGGSTELMIMDRGKIVAAHLFRLGILRYENQWYVSRGEGSNEIQLEEQFRNTLEGVRSEFNLAKIRFFVMVGGDARTAAVQIGDRRGEHYSVISRAKFLEFLAKIEDYSTEECVRQLSISYLEAESLVPALKIHRMFLCETTAEEVIVPDVSIREGVLLRFALGDDPQTQKQYEDQVLASALSLGRKCHFDEDHAQQVVRLSALLFDAFATEHGMGHRERLFLLTAAMLHDIGYFVKSSGHHKHGAYLVAHSEVFGLGQEDMQVLAQMVRYHRATRPDPEHPEFATLSQESRLLVSKCVALLRVADCLDRSHTQRIRNPEIIVLDEEMVIKSNYQGDLSAERAALQQKGSFFSEVFGFMVALR